ncbi:hypothetical protein SprV_0401675300 [Sparganum proliferum]
MASIDVDLREVPKLQHVSLIYRLQRTFDEILLDACLLRPVNTSSTVQKISLRVDDGFQLLLQVSKDIAFSPEQVTAEHNRLRICPNSSEEEHSSNCTRSASPEEGREVYFNGRMSGRLHDYLSVRINGTTVFAQLLTSEDSIEEELRKVQDLLRENGYPDRFIAKNLAERPAKPTTLTAKKKNVVPQSPLPRRRCR